MPAKAGIHGRHGPRPSPGWRAFLASSFLLLAAPAYAADIAGTWYGEGYQPLWREEAQWLMRLGSDGSYAIHFRRYRDCTLTLDQRETGTWALGDTFRTTTLSVDGAPTKYENDYRIGAMSAAEMRLVHSGTGQEYVEKRVAPDFVLPKPECVSS